jgi:hypothetical protein
MTVTADTVVDRFSREWMCTGHPDGRYGGDRSAAALTRWSSWRPGYHRDNVTARETGATINGRGSGFALSEVVSGTGSGRSVSLAYRTR